MSSVQAVEAPAPAVSQSPSAPRKRRRRAAATGAAEDCFSCQKRQTRCDRRRPYCTQCLDIGKDCSGYKTTLTWGVGVASRGKLRGLSLPIVNSTQKAAQGPKDNKHQLSSPPKSASCSPKSTGNLVKPKPEQQSSFPMVIPGSIDSVTPTFVSTGHPHSAAPIAIPTLSQTPTTHHATWQIPSFHEHHLDGFGSMTNKSSPRNEIRPAPLQRMHSFPASSYDEIVFPTPPTATGSVSTFSDGDFPSPNDFPPTPENVPCTEPFINNQLDLFLCGPDGNPTAEQYHFETPSHPHFAVSNEVNLGLGLQPTDTPCTNVFHTGQFNTVVPTTFCESLPVTVSNVPSVSNVSSVSNVPHVPTVVPHYSFPSSGVESLGYYCASELGRYQLPPPLNTHDNPIRLL